MTSKPAARPRRSEVLAQVAALVPPATGDSCTRLGVDGVDGSGKTVFAAELAVALREAGREVVQVSLDDFHHVREVRYRRGRTSPEGFWLDSFDYSRFVAEVLEPLGPGGSRRYRPRGHDLTTDEVVDGPLAVAPPGAVLVVGFYAIGLRMLVRAGRAPVVAPAEFTDAITVITEKEARRAAKAAAKAARKSPLTEGQKTLALVAAVAAFSVSGLAVLGGLLLIVLH